jgi:hypothetical protein
MKKTAVDYLFEKLWGIPKDKFTWQMILQEAKKKEKKQMKDAYTDCEFETPFDSHHAFEDYYKKTYQDQ